MSRLVANNVKEVFSNYKEAQRILNKKITLNSQCYISNVTATYHKFSNIKYSEMLTIYGDRNHRGKILTINRGLEFQENKSSHTITIKFEHMTEIIEALLVSQIYGPDVDPEQVDMYYTLSDWLKNLGNIVVCRRYNGANNGRYVLVMTKNVPVDNRTNTNINEPVKMLINNQIYDVYGYILIKEFIDKMKSVNVGHTPSFCYEFKDTSAWTLFKYIFMTYAVAKYHNWNISLKDHILDTITVYKDENRILYDEPMVLLNDVEI